MRFVLPVWALLSAFATTARAAGIIVAAGSGQAAAGADFSTDITTHGGAPLGAMQFVLSWDPAVLEYKSLDKAKLLADGAMLDSKADPSGHLSVAWVAGEAIDAEGPLLTVHFAVKGQGGQHSTLAVEKLRAWGPGSAHHASAADQHLIDVQAKPGDPSTFSVATASMNTYLYAIGGAVILLILLLVLFYTLRKRPPPHAH